MWEQYDRRRVTDDLTLVPFSFSGYKGLAFHRLLLEDSVRTESFRRAIAKVVKEGDVVVDLGAGTGILSYFACQAGAARVYAIESDSIIEVARLVARQNGMDDRITFIKESSWMTNLPEHVDVVVSEVWRQVFFPIAREVEVEAGSVVDVRLVLRRSETDVCGCFEWAVGVRDGGERRTIATQSTRASYPYDIGELCEGMTCRPDVDGRTRNAGIERRELLKWIVTKL